MRVTYALPQSSAPTRVGPRRVCVKVPDRLTAGIRLPLLGFGYSLGLHQQRENASCERKKRQRPDAAASQAEAGRGIVMADVRVSSAELLRFVTAVFSAAGMSTADAA